MCSRRNHYARPVLRSRQLQPSRQGWQQTCPHQRRLPRSRRPGHHKDARPGQLSRYSPNELRGQSLPSVEHLRIGFIKRSQSPVRAAANPPRSMTRHPVPSPRTATATPRRGLLACKARFCSGPADALHDDAQLRRLRILARLNIGSCRRHITKHELHSGKTCAEATDRGNNIAAKQLITCLKCLPQSSAPGINFSQDHGDLRAKSMRPIIPHSQRHLNLPCDLLLHIICRSQGFSRTSTKPVQRRGHNTTQDTAAERRQDPDPAHGHSASDPGTDR